MKIHAVEPRPTLVWGVPVLSVISANERTKTSSSSSRLATRINELFSLGFFNSPFSDKHTTKCATLNAYSKYDILVSINGYQCLTDKRLEEGLTENRPLIQIKQTVIYKLPEVSTR